MIIKKVKGEERMGTITISRESQFMNKMRSYDIYVDGEKIGEIKNGGTEELPVPPGEHVIQLQIDWCKSKEIPFRLSEGEKQSFQCGSRLKGWKVLKASSSMDKEDVFVYLDQV